MSRDILKARSKNRIKVVAPISCYVFISKIFTSRGPGTRRNCCGDQFSSRRERVLSLKSAFLIPSLCLSVITFQI